MFIPCITGWSPHWAVTKADRPRFVGPCLTLFNFKASRPKSPHQLGALSHLHLWWSRQGAKAPVPCLCPGCHEYLKFKMFGGSMLQTTKMFGLWFFNAHCATITASKSSSVIWSTRFGGILFKAGGVPTNSPTRFMKCSNSIDKQTMKNANFQCSLSKMCQKTSVERSISILKEKDKIHFEQTISGGKNIFMPPGWQPHLLLGWSPLRGTIPL